MTHIGPWRAGFEKELEPVDANAIERVIEDSGLPARLLSFERRIVRLAVLDRGQRVVELDLSISEFCDMVLEHRERELLRQRVPAILTAA
jgi:hypothetical protein